MSAVMALGLVACTGPAPQLPAVTPTELPADRPTASPTSAAALPLTVAMPGEINCALFPYTCWAVVSVPSPGTTIDAAWRPPESDPRWLPHDLGQGRFDLALADPAPTIEAGAHQVVVSLLGMSDVVSFNPDGTVATDLLARCSTTIDTNEQGPPPGLVVTFAPGETGWPAACTIDVAEP